jgi:hypothetical protein
MTLYLLLLPLAVPAAASSQTPEEELPHLSTDENHMIRLTRDASSLLCLPDHYPDNHTDVRLLCHRMCPQPGRATCSLVDADRSLAHVSRDVACGYTDESRLRCRLKQTTRKCSKYVKVTCGGCHFRYNVSVNTSLVLESPLYPLLPPGVVCQYDLHLDRPRETSMVLNITDLSLPRHWHDQDDQQPACLNSFLQIQRSKRDYGYINVDRLCEKNKHDVHNVYNISDVNVRLLFVSGYNYQKDSKGFSITVTANNVSTTRRSPTKMVAVFFLVFFLVVLTIAVVWCLASMAIKGTKRPRTRERGSTWHGAQPVGGQTLHDAETAEVNRQYRQVRNTNPYVVDNTVSGRTGPLPSPPPPEPQPPGRAGPLPSPPQPPGMVVVDTDGIYETASYIQDYEYGNQSGSVTSYEPSLSSYTVSGVSLVSAEYLCMRPPVPRRPTWTLESTCDEKSATSPTASFLNATDATALYVTVNKVRKEPEPSVTLASPLYLSLRKKSLGGEGHFEQMSSSSRGRERPWLFTGTDRCPTRLHPAQSTTGNSHGEPCLVGGGTRRLSANMTFSISSMLHRVRSSVSGLRSTRMTSRDLEVLVGKEGSSNHSDCSETDEVFY